jgi:hypothetical protein
LALWFGWSFGYWLVWLVRGFGLVRAGFVLVIGWLI